MKLNTILIALVVSIYGCSKPVMYSTSYKGMTSESYTLKKKKFKYSFAGGMQNPYNLKGEYLIEGDSIIFYFKNWEKKMDILTPFVNEKRRASNTGTTMNFFIVKRNHDTLPLIYPQLIINDTFQFEADSLGIIRINKTGIRKIQVINTITYPAHFIKDFQANYFEVYFKEWPHVNELPSGNIYSLTNTVKSMKYYNDSLFDGKRAFYRKRD